MTTTIFLPQSRMDSRKARSLSVNGRSAEVTNRTRSERGTNSRVSASCSRNTALVPGVSTMLMSRSISRGAVITSSARGIGFPVHGGAVLEQADAGGGGGDPFLEHAQPEERVDERALARVELAHDHEQEQLVELAERALEGVLVFRLHVEPGEHRAQVRQRLALFGEQGPLALGEDALLQ